MGGRVGGWVGVVESMHRRGKGQRQRWQARPGGGGGRAWRGGKAWGEGGGGRGERIVEFITSLVHRNKYEGIDDKRARRARVDYEREGAGFQERERTGLH